MSCIWLLIVRYFGVAFGLECDGLGFALLVSCRLGYCGLRY